MGTLTHKAARAAYGTAIDAVLKHVKKDREKGCRFTWYFHYMPVENDAAEELLPTKEQREYM